MGERQRQWQATLKSMTQWELQNAYGSAWNLNPVWLWTNKGQRHDSSISLVQTKMGMTAAFHEC
eukprot:1159406-Pelagomonas_calceolata.AAC.19